MGHRTWYRESIEVERTSIQYHKNTTPTKREQSFIEIHRRRKIRSRQVIGEEHY